MNPEVPLTGSGYLKFCAGKNSEAILRSSGERGMSAMVTHVPARGSGQALLALWLPSKIATGHWELQMLLVKLTCVITVKYTPDFEGVVKPVLRRNLTASWSVILRSVYHRQKYVKMQVPGWGGNVGSGNCIIILRPLSHDSQAYLRITALCHR